MPMAQSYVPTNYFSEMTPLGHYKWDLTRIESYICYPDHCKVSGHTLPTMNGSRVPITLSKGGHNNICQSVP